MYCFLATNFDDPAQQEVALPGWEQRILQLAPPLYSASIHYLIMPGIRIMRERVNVRVAQSTCTPPDAITFIFTINQDARWRIDAACFAGTNASITVGRHEFSCVNDADYDILIVSVDRDRFPIDTSMVSGVRFVAGLAPQQCLDWLLGLLESWRETGKSANSELDTLLPDIIVDQLCHLYLLQSETAPVRNGDSMDARVFRQIGKTLDEGDASTYSIDAVSSVTGLTRQTIYQAVDNTLGIDAGTWLRRLRLEGARRDMLLHRCSGKSVAEVAFKWRFWHLSRFAQYYRSQFGESPSQTLKALARC